MTKSKVYQFFVCIIALYCLCIGTNGENITDETSVSAANDLIALSAQIRNDLLELRIMADKSRKEARIVLSDLRSELSLIREEFGKTTQDCKTNQTTVQPVTSLVSKFPTVQNVSTHSKYYYLINVGSGKCAVAENNGIADFSRVVQWPCITSENHAKGRIVEFINQDCQGAYQIRNLHSGLCYVVHFASIQDNYGIDQFNCAEDLPNSRWRIQNVDKSGSGAFQLFNIGSHKCLTVMGSSTANGALIVHYACENNLPDKFWKLQAVDL